MASKYLKGGALNPVWCDEQDAEYMAEQISEEIISLLECTDMSIDMDLGSGVEVHIPGKSEKIMDALLEDELEDEDVSVEEELEAKFLFLKKHSGNPEDLELAKLILGIK